MVENLRPTGIEPLGDMPWGSHICLFFETSDDLLDTVVSFFAAGARNNERCFWAVSAPITEAQAIEALGRRVPDLDRRLAEGAIEIQPAEAWYLEGDRLDVTRITDAWDEKLAGALAHGFDGLRMSGNAFWMETGHRNVFCEYERGLGPWLASRPILALCTYPAEHSRAADVLDVTRAHQFTLARRRGEWEVIETLELKQAKRELARRKAELEERVSLRTRELAAANAQLQAEINERERAEAALALARTELAQAARLTSLGFLAASIAHEVNQPLAAIVTNSEASLRLLARDPPDIREAGAALDQIARDARRASNVIQRIRDLAAGTSKHVDVDLNAAIREVCELMRPQFQARGVKLRLELSAVAPHAFGDRLQLQQAIGNLVVNAAEALTDESPSREVAVRTGIDDGAAVVSVEDRGRGLDAETVDRLSDPFFTTKSDGMGIGLSIVRWIAEAHGGRLSASPGYGGGAVFQLVIPSRGDAA